MDALKEQPSLFGARLKQMRERRRLTQHELAERADTAYNTIWRLERGRRHTTTVEVGARLARALHTSLDYLAGIYDEREERPAVPVPRAARGKAKKAYG